MKDSNVLIVTEVNNKVASGHLFECLVCYEELQEDCNVYLMVNADMPPLFKKVRRSSISNIDPIYRRKRRRWHIMFRNMK